MAEGHPAGPGDGDQARAGEENVARADRPLDLVLAMLAAYPKLGKSLFPRNTWRQSIVGDEFADIGEGLLAACSSAGRCPLAALARPAYEMIAARYALGRLTEQQHEFLRGTIAVDIRIAMRRCMRWASSCLTWARARARTGGAELTDLGRYAVRRLRGMAQPGDPLLEVRITLADVADPQVWRRVLIPRLTRLTGCTA